MTATRTKHELSRDLVRALRALRNADSEHRLRRLREVARLTFDLREHFLTPAGEPDWAGRTWAYRNHVREQYKEAGYEADEATNTQSNVRYHISNLARTRLSEDEIASLGLRKETPVEYNRSQRATARALLEAAQAAGKADDTEDVLRMLGTALLMLQKIPAATIGDMEADDRQKARGVLSKLRGIVADQLDATGREE
ncbi:hypothetical protein Acy02nite_68570 [Actinoplanes cyaneus]|uniref:Uncharacterized protein n=1 Tax=Actinoplanes cyaneus TaxID=52696 RepID=A0A919MF90_9ACTN|nr:hypothetical protein [Actinoplanes cyaneus]MCW2139094.1 hypothetical protein [Actinoplanes cyaneus]GID68976.1 hypothetical protein Acy02nite_68570 [Actinoplanes cyaneus]